MTAPSQVWIVDNAGWPNARPAISVLIPFLRDDPCALLQALDREAGRLAGRVEIVALDDGTGDSALAERVGGAIMAMACPARFVRLAANEGRSKGRNRLMANARGRYLLFLDSDMAPDTERFLANYLSLIAAEDPAVAFGGFTLDQTPVTREHALHRAVTLRADCRPAAERQAEPAKTVCASNLLVRRDVFEQEAFDERFVGWGWEEVEWAIRVARRWPVRHIDNSASHIGLDTAPALLGKYVQSKGNFARMVADHRDVVRDFPSYKVARLLALVPARPLWRNALKRVALADSAPLPARVLATKLFRAALYADVVR
jgi:glycosyltransferase involved in cell wall biosynthesis